MTLHLVGRLWEELWRLVPRPAGGRPGSEAVVVELPPAKWPEPEATRMRVVVEGPASSTTHDVVDALQSAGLEVALCHGPTSELPCPLIEQGNCSLVGGADVVLNMLDPASDHRPDLLEALDITERPAVLAIGSDPLGLTRVRVLDVDHLESPTVLREVMHSIEDPTGQDADRGSAET